MDTTLVIENLRTHRARLWHAHYLHEARIYASEGGIIARSRLMNYPGVEDIFSDEADVRLGLLDKVFYNLNDQGVACKKGNGIPNAYGPISFVMDAGALLESSKVTVLKDSVSNTEKTGLLQCETIEEVDALFEQEGGSFLSQAFAHPEVIVHADFVPFKYLRYIQVDPITANGTSLVTVVGKLFPGVTIYPRQLVENGPAVHTALIQWTIDTEGKLNTPPPEKLITLWERNSGISARGTQAAGQERIRLWAGRTFRNVIQAMQNQESSGQ